MNKEIFVTKADGERELFDDSKLVSSLKRSGASNDVVSSIVDHIKAEIEDGTSTSHIYKHAFYLLKKINRPVAARYSLRRAMVGFGPTGFPFEKYIAQVFKAKGFESVTNQIVMGSCVSHEIDVVAYNEDKLIMVEAKFHNTLTEKTDLKVALYVKARYDDLIEQNFSFGGKTRSLTEGWLITNTKFTDNAIRYGECVGLKMMSFNYPEKGNLADFIEDSGLHPLTCLTTLSQSEKSSLLAKGKVLCSDVKDKSMLKEVGIKDDKISKIHEEAVALCEI